jgi:hypothetical protein
MYICQYYDNVTPSEYQPEYFIDACSDELKFVAHPLKIKVGKLETPYHTLQLKFAGLESLLNEDKDSISLQTSKLCIQPNQLFPKKHINEEKDKSENKNDNITHYEDDAGGETFESESVTEESPVIFNKITSPSAHDDQHVHAVKQFMSVFIHHLSHDIC